MTADIDIKTELYDVWVSKGKEAIAMVAGVQGRSLSATVGLGARSATSIGGGASGRYLASGLVTHSQDARSGASYARCVPTGSSVLIFEIGFGGESLPLE